MASTVARGSHLNSMYVKPVLRKAYHKKSGSNMISDAVKLNGEEVKSKGSLVGDQRDNGDWWVPHNRTGIYYPKGHEKVIEAVSTAKDVEINWSHNQDENYFN